MPLTYKQLQNQLLHKNLHEEYLKKRVKTLREELIRKTEIEKSLIVNYEKIIKEWISRYENVLHNWWRILLVKFILWYNDKRGIKGDV